MDFDVVVSSRANARLDAAIVYLANVLCSPRAASRLLDGFQLALHDLRTNPTFAVVAREVSDALSQTVYQRRMGNYKILFCVDAQRRVVTVFSFLHSRQDQGAIASEDFSEL